MTEHPTHSSPLQVKPRSKPQPVYLNPDDIHRELHKLFPPEKIEQIAKETGLIKRRRILDPVPFLWALILGFGTYLQRTLEGLRRVYNKEADEQIAESSWHGRFTPETVRFLKACTLHALKQTVSEKARTLEDRLQSFLDVFVQDNTVIRLHKVLAKKWPATRSRVVAAGIKVALMISAVANGPATVAIHAERTADVKTIRIGRWIKDRIILFDLGYFKFQLFARVKENGGYFVSRLKDNCDPVFLRSLTVHRGQAIDLAGKNWKDVKDLLQRKTLDAEVELTFSRRIYAGRHTKDSMVLRLVAVYDEEEKDYHVYLTNIPPAVLKAEDVAALYAVRWEIELVFKELKGHYSLDIIKTQKPTIVLGLVWTAILTLIVSRKLYNLLLRSVPAELRPRYPPLRWSIIFVENGQRLLDAMMGNIGFEPPREGDFNRLAQTYERDALDPHVKRYRLREGWLA